MMRYAAAVAALLAAAPAMAQVPPVYTPDTPPGALQPPLPSAPQSPAPQSPAPRSPAPPPPAAGGVQAPAPPSPAEAPEQWLARGGFELRALDKVNARPLTLSGRVGQPIKYGSLTINVRNCVVRPPDQPANSAAFLDISNSLPNAPGFHGWMFANEPALSMFEHPLYDIRLTGCRP